ncbi:MAG: methionyl-tRNA formyltransferase, partial [Candidatus Yanofskybacteria bacterium]|nr:methionyl-tRNA formyltransferase [Candidatus Yanofskybacteria bacterium]
IMSKDAKISFWGTPALALPAFEVLIEAGYRIVSVVTVPDMPVGREKTLTPSPVKRLALENNLNVFTPLHLSDKDFFERFQADKPDVAVVAAYGKIIPERYLTVPERGFINIHPSLLPQYRGPSPIQTAIMQGDKKTGVTIMLVDREMDHGAILAQETYQLDSEEYFPEISEGLAKQSAKLLISVLPRWLSGDIQPQEQEHARATFTKMVSRQDGQIDWHQSAIQIYNKIRALNPEPGTWTHLNSSIFKIFKAKPYISQEIAPPEPGSISISRNQFMIKTGEGWLVPEEMQVEGKRRVSAAEFIRGYRRLNGIIVS